MTVYRMRLEGRTARLRGTGQCWGQQPSVWRAVYDALVGAAARQHRLRLVSVDVRARPIYEALGVKLEARP
jgi:hypothetical protein